VSFDPALPDDQVNVSRTHPLREAALLVGGLLAVVALFALVTAFAVDLAVPRLPAGLEMKIFSGTWLAPDGEGEEPDADAALLQDLVDRLARHWPENPYTVRAAVWQAEQVNAFALPGGWVVVSTGLLEQTASENELAFILGHEIGHFRNRDHLRGLGRGVALGLVLAALSTSGAGSAADLASLAGQLTQRSFDRGQEVDADAFGLALVAEEYGHVAGAGDFFRNASGSGGLLGENLEGYLSTHPLHEDRIESLAALAAERGWPTQGSLVPLRE
jgi:Zn-dependent protease with chaperone function